MIPTRREMDELSYDETLLRGISQAVRSTHISDRNANRRMDPRIVVYASRSVEFSQRLGDQNMRIRNETADLYEDIG
jgi:hypothetical protein